MRDRCHGLRAGGALCPRSQRRTLPAAKLVRKEATQLSGPDPSIRERSWPAAKHRAFGAGKTLTPPRTHMVGGISVSAIMVAAILALGVLSACATSPRPYDETRTAPIGNPAPSNPLVTDLLEKGPSRMELSQAEQALYRRIMDYRKENGLPPIPPSRSLSFVAKLHVLDLESNTLPTSANYHSWSSNGPWRSVNYTPDHRLSKFMWTKPSELTRYRGNGYEIVHMNSESATCQGAFLAWKASGPHNAVLLNQGDWRRLDWGAIGVGIYGRYAAVWFGERTDPEATVPDGPGGRLANR